MSSVAAVGNRHIGGVTKQNASADSLMTSADERSTGGRSSCVGATRALEPVADSDSADAPACGDGALSASEWFELGG